MTIPDEFCAVARFVELLLLPVDRKTPQPCAGKESPECVSILADVLGTPCNVLPFKACQTFLGHVAPTKLEECLVVGERRPGVGPFNRPQQYVDETPINILLASLGQFEEPENEFHGRKVILGELNRRRHIEPDEESLLSRKERSSFPHWKVRHDGAVRVRMTSDLNSWKNEGDGTRGHDRFHKPIRPGGDADSPFLARFHLRPQR